MGVSVSDEQVRPVDIEDLASLARHVLRARGVADDMHVDLLLVDRERIAALNQEHLGVEGPTDVLAFPIDAPDELPEGVPGILGDVLACPAVAAEQADEDGGGEHAELQFLVVHGILHLLGMDHAAEEDEREMFALTDRLLASYRENRAPERESSSAPAAGRQDSHGRESSSAPAAGRQDSHGRESSSAPAAGRQDSRGHVR